MISSEKQFKDLRVLWEAIDDAPSSPACENFPDAYFPEHSGMTHEGMWAKAMCSDCPIRMQCAEYGIKWEKHGFWGGMSPRERERARKARNLPPLRDEEELAA